MSSPAPTTFTTRHGEAGRAGGEVRSDLHVTFEERSSGGIQIDLRSRVDLYYGEHIRQQATNVLHSLGVEHATLTIVDEGGHAQANPITINAAPGETISGVPSISIATNFATVTLRSNPTDGTWSVPQ